MGYTKKLLKEVGVEPGRLEMFNMSSSMATAFVAAVNEMTRRAKEMGPSPLRGKQEAAQGQVAAS